MIDVHFGQKLSIKTNKINVLWSNWNAHVNLHFCLSKYWQTSRRMPKSEYYKQESRTYSKILPVCRKFWPVSSTCQSHPWIEELLVIKKVRAALHTEPVYLYVFCPDWKVTQLKITQTCPKVGVPFLDLSPSRAKSLVPIAAYPKSAALYAAGIFKHSVPGITNNVVCLSFSSF